MSWQQFINYDPFRRWMRTALGVDEQGNRLEKFSPGTFGTAGEQGSSYDQAWDAAQSLGLYGARDEAQNMLRDDRTAAEQKALGQLGYQYEWTGPQSFEFGMQGDWNLQGPMRSGEWLTPPDADLMAMYPYDPRKWDRDTDEFQDLSRRAGVLDNNQYNVLRKILLGGR